jgi:hypothetical protein
MLQHGRQQVEPDLGAARRGFGDVDVSGQTQHAIAEQCAVTRQAEKHHQHHQGAERPARHSAELHQVPEHVSAHRDGQDQANDAAA